MHLVRATAVALFAVVACDACEGTDGLAGGVAPERVDAGSRRDAGDADAPAGDVDGGPKPNLSRCDPLEPFGPPELQTDLEPTAYTVRAAVVSPDELEIHYLRYTPNDSNWELRRATRPSRDARWEPAVTVPGIPAVAGMSMSAGGLKIHYWTADSNFVASRKSVDDTFADPKTFWLEKKPQLFVVAADDAAYFAELVVFGTTTERIIRRAPMNPNATGLLTPVEVPKIHAKGALDSQPVLNADETALYFSSNREGGKGLSDIWVARRGTKLDAFGPPVHVPELSTETVDAVSWVSNDDCEILVERASHIYRAKRPL